MKKLLNRRFILQNSVITSIGLSLLNTLQFGCNSNSTEPKKPNFIFIYADNMGYGDLGCFGSEHHILITWQKKVCV